MTGQNPETELATVFAHLQGLLLSHRVATEAVGHLAQTAADLIGSAAGAEVSLLDETGSRITTAATDPVVAAADTTQYDLDEGACLTAWATDTVQRLEDTATDTRWPAFSAALVPSGVASMLSVPLVHAERTNGLNRCQQVPTQLGPSRFTDGPDTGQHAAGALALAAAR